ncbi:MAG: hypothetical protein HKN84_05000 [Gammaproteobacteria bacterium]|nr:hypothetical protein [Gammaproteobacteria bacterium]
MKTFDETYADRDFQQQIAFARESWMDQVPRPAQPDLDVEGLSTSFVGRLLRVLGRKSS